MPVDRLLLTRPRAQSERFARVCSKAFGPDLRIVISPVQEIVLLQASLDLTGLKGLIFTSENGVRAFAALSPIRDLPAFCVGSRTAEAARAAGFAATAGDGGTTALANLIATAAPDGPLLHLHGENVAGDIVSDLSARGISCRTLTVYDQRELPLTAEATTLLSEPQRLLVPVFSARTARILSAAIAGARADLQIAAISPAVADLLREHRNARIVVSKRSDGASMLTTLTGLRESGSRLER